MPSCCTTEARRRRSADADLLDGTPSWLARAARSRSRRASAAAIAAVSGSEAAAIRVSRVTEQPAEAKPRQLRDPRERVGGVGPIGIDAAAMKADIHLHQDVDRAIGASGSRARDHSRATSRSSTMNESRIRSGERDVRDRR